MNNRRLILWVILLISVSMGFLSNLTIFLSMVMVVILYMLYEVLPKIIRREKKDTRPDDGPQT